MRYTSLAIAALVLAACGSDSTGPGTVAGVYRLKTLDGQPLPYHFDDVNGYSEVLSGEVQLGRTGRFEAVLTTRFAQCAGTGEERQCTEPQQHTSSQTGGYVVKGDTIDIVVILPMPNPPDYWQGRIQGGRLTLGRGVYVRTSPWSGL